MFEDFFAWVLVFIESFGLMGAFVISLLESFILPIPTALIIAPLAAMGFDPLLITVVCTVGSVIGAAIGYYLGMKLGRPAADKLISKQMPRVEKMYEKYGAWAVLISAFSPIPFKVFTWMSGILGLDFKKFIIASAIGRFAQFAVAAYLGSIFAPLLGF